MAKGINKVILIGNLGTDPEVRYMSNGQAVCNLSLATSESWRDKQTNELQEKTEWHRVVLFRRLAEIAGEYLKKGGKVYIEGRLRTRKWQDQNGQDRYTTEIHADELQMLDSRGTQNTAYGNQKMDSDQYLGHGEQQAFSRDAQRSTSPLESAKALDDGLNDDIPF